MSLRHALTLAALVAPVALSTVTACSAPAPTMTPRQLCEKNEPLAEAWRVANGQDAATPERAAAAMKGCEEHWSEQQAADPAFFARVTACVDKVSTYDAIEQCVIDGLEKK